MMLPLRTGTFLFNILFLPWEMECVWLKTPVWLQVALMKDRVKAKGGEALGRAGGTAPRSTSALPKSF